MKLIIMSLLILSVLYASNIPDEYRKNVSSSTHVPQDDFDSKQAKELLQKSRKLWKEGELEQAISKILEAQKLSPRNMVITKSSTAMQKQKEMIDKKLQKTIDSIGMGKFEEGDKLLSSAGLISNKYSRYISVKNKLIAAKNEKFVNKKTKQSLEVKQQDKAGSDKSFRQKVVELLILFRLEAFVDSNASFDKYADIATSKELHGLGSILSPISDISYGWQSFFGSSVVGITSLSEHIALAMFYNPWADVALLCEWSKLGDVPKITQVKLLSGDEIRNTEISLLLPQWHRTRDVPPPLSAVVQNADTMQAFLDLYGKQQPSWPAKQWPDKLPSLKTDDPKKDSEKNVGLFFSHNLISISTLMHDPINAKIKSSMEEIQQQLRTGKTEELMSRTPEMLKENRELLSRMAPEYWKHTRIVSFASNSKHAFIFISSPFDPQMFVSFWFDIRDDSNPKLSRIDFFGYDLSFEEVDKLARQAGMKRPQTILNENGGSL